MKTSESLLSKGKFIAEYSAHLMGAGVHTSRVVRNSKRIGEAFGLDVKLGVFHKNIILTIIDKQTNEACNFFQAEDGIRDYKVTGVQTCALPISARDLLTPKG